MELIIVRHAEPNYELDTLTEKGWKEAALLAERIAKLNVTDFYVSPFGRAQDTASLTLKKMGRTAETLEWLKEFDARIHRPDHDGLDCVWDWMPEDWADQSCFYDADHWYDQPIMQEGHVKERYQWVIENFDAFLEKYGYVRHGNYYETTRECHATVVLFCHFGLQCVLLSRLMNVSPMILWHGLAAPASSVTTVYSEERRKGKTSFRVSSFGDISHLYAADEKPSFMVRYCECYSDKTTH